MPAIQLDRLNKQAKSLAEKFNQPAYYVRELRDICEFYANRTRRNRQSGAPDPVIPTYNIPDPVLRRVLFTITPNITEDPESALLLADACWADEYLEFKILAARMLGRLPIESVGSIAERITPWAQSNPEAVLENTLADQALAQLRKSAQKQLTEMIEGWLKTDKFRLQVLGLLALTALLDEPTFENLPRIYRILSPRLIQSKNTIQPYVLQVIEKLAARSSLETAQYLREHLQEDTVSKTTRWVVRYALDAFPDTQAQSLRNTLRDL